ncbi:hypothetical protein GCK32_003583 [Trichostrongylus colubriformis]|uniref:Uncharacterized protein n=1 Tax=Trichostrongylus colubriformis TaxID=6319 RepID=A0AAN8FLN3_TRICO
MGVSVAAAIVALRPCIEAMLVRSCMNPESLMAATDQDRELCSLLRAISSREFFAGGGPLKDDLLTDAALVQPINAGRGRGGRFGVGGGRGERGGPGGGGRGWRGGSLGGGSSFTGGAEGGGANGSLLSGRADNGDNFNGNSSAMNHSGKSHNIGFKH